MRSGLCDLTLLVIHETEKAMLLAETEEDKGKWLPKSQFEINSDTKAKGKRIIEITLEQWIAEREGFV